MKRFICIVTLLCAIFTVQQIVAQPKMRREQQENKEAGPTLSVRAQSQYAGQLSMPEETVWNREIYRKLNLKEAKNTALYYPTEPMGDRANLFSLIFKLMAEGKISAYEYRLDGTELLTKDNRIDFKDVLDRFHIYYQEKVENRDTTLVIDNSDIPSAEVLSYFIKENWFFDQRSSIYSSKIAALCPVLHRADDFAMESTTYPMFWLDYKDLTPYLSRMPIMTSDLNNAANISIDDYFTTRLFKGDIYKTTNMLNQSLAQYCPTDSALVKEQKRIETQLETFGKNLWGVAKTELQVVSEDSVALASADKEEAKATTRNSKKKGLDRAKSSSSSSSSKTKVKKSSSSSSKSSSGPRVSVRRQRR